MTTTLLNTTQAAKLCGVSRQTIYTWVKDQYLKPAARVKRATGGWTWLYNEGDLYTLADRRHRSEIAS